MEDESLDLVARRFNRDGRLDIQLAEIVLDLLDELDALAHAKDLDDGDSDSMYYRKISLAYFAALVICSGRTMILAHLRGQGLDAVKMSRFLLDYLTSAEYYTQFPEEAVLFITSCFNEQVDMADQIRTFQEDPKFRDIEYQELLKHRERLARNTAVSVRAKRRMERNFGGTGPRQTSAKCSRG